jgi:hypothetical protein
LLITCGDSLAAREIQVIKAFRTLQYSEILTILMHSPMRIGISSKLSQAARHGQPDDGMLGSRLVAGFEFPLPGKS